MKPFYINSKFDYRGLMAKHDVDEILIVNARHGVLVSYFGVIEVEKQAYVEISTEIIDLNDNSLLQQQDLENPSTIKGHWKKGENYENLRRSIEEAISKSFRELRSKF